MHAPDSRLALPPHLKERLCRLTGPARAGGAPVVCWLRRTLRAEENPVLDVATLVARAMRRPLLVLVALHESTRWASDRHHLFALQSARDLALALKKRGVPCAVHVERPGARQPVVKLLARQATLLVADEVPLAPWRDELDRIKGAGPVWTVDGSCVVPMALSEEAPKRAFAFRDRFADARAERLSIAWPGLDAANTPPLPALPFKPTPVEDRAGHPPMTALPFEPTPVDDRAGHPPMTALPFEPVPVAELGDAALLDLIAQCEIDHGVAPVPGMPGGSREGWARWEAFRDTRLRAYADRRNDAVDVEGVSGLSPWLNHGCISPLRVAREARAVGGRGADKFLDELLIWREVAWHFCWHSARPEHMEALPGWARETLEAHAGNPRPALFDEETLAMGRTGDALWDTAAESLRVLGVLHNNVRMTWGKQLVQWSPDPQTALARLIELNHRYALDGRDPASIGGLLWCMGLFDRPFSPEQPVLGSVRARDSATHARRLDVAAWREALGLA